MKTNKDKCVHYDKIVERESEKQWINEEEIRQQAKDFFDKWLPKWEKYCELCGALNCKDNKSCINCNCQF